MPHSAAGPVMSEMPAPTRYPAVGAADAMAVGPGATVAATASAAEAAPVRASRVRRFISGERVPLTASCINPPFLRVGANHTTGQSSSRQPDRYMGSRELTAGVRNA